MQCYQCGGTTKLESSYRLFPYVVRQFRCGVCKAISKKLETLASGDMVGRFQLTTGAELYRRQQAHQ
jgi:hypothetical protein